MVFVALVLVSLLLTPLVSGYSSHDVKSWCSQTPYPQPCEYFLSHKPDHSPIKQKSDFLNISMQVALEQAMTAHSNIFSLGSKCRNEREKAAWNDCVELYDHTILKLNKTLDPNTRCTQVDAQTWLSTALTNLQTCQDGFIELGVSDHFLPLISNNVSKLISNTLSINKVPYAEPSYKGGYPTWVKPGDRKLLQSSSLASQANIVVSKDGSGDYTTIGSSNHCSIQAIRKSVGGGSTTYNSATVAVVGDGFIACGMTIRNTAWRRPTTRQWLYDPVVFQKCNIYARNPPNKVNTVTAQGRTDPNQNTGISIHDCEVTAASDLKPVQSSVKTYLGRPWKEYSRTVFLKTYLDSLINSAGWLEWSGDFALNTLYYGEYMNTGPGSSTSGRVNWTGYHVITSSTEAAKFTVGNFISGNSWLPSTNVPFTSGL
ncbi:Pectinesterase 2 [Vitis vinifera]|uniref:Pectinesterase 2 n=1 Tax=Vitis vinifera TaxID=29760 RepID=A0A438I804_VITVI|nr:Pectinesterase 2 [Vitis vinifera]